jgi:hypothetical protein
MQKKLRELAKDIKTTQEKATNLENASTETLLKMYSAIEDARKADDATPSGQNKEYGVREHRDLREEACAIEEILDKRSVVYEKIVW